MSRPAAPAGLRKLSLLPLAAATYFMVAGGPYGLEDIIGRAGYFLALLILLVVPFVWSLPTALMIGELTTAIPAEGGFYVWVRRALGPFWGFQEAWLSLAASVFDMAIYPRIFVDYLSRLAPALTSGHRAELWALAIVLLCMLWNLRGAHAVGSGSVAFLALLFLPFAFMMLIGLWHGLTAHSLGFLTQRAPAVDLTGAILFALWNYMGWDNASTIAQEVEHPQRNYPRAILAATALVTAGYILPVAAVAIARMPADQFSSGAWTDAGRYLGGPWLAIAMVAGGAITGISMFNALSMSYARLPFALAQDNLLPRSFSRRLSNGAPWLSILVCSAAWALALQFSFLRLITMDLVLYGLSLILEFVALITLRLRQPHLIRPFRVPGGIVGVLLAGAAPTALILFAIYAARDERCAGMPALAFALIVAAAGALFYLIAAAHAHHATIPINEKTALD